MAELWTINLATGAADRVTRNKATDATPVWSPDGARLVFRSNRGGSHELWERLVRPGAEDSRLFESALGVYPTDWSPDGRAIVYHERLQETRHDIVLLDRATGMSKPLLGSPAEEAQGQLSVDGRLAYTSDASGEFNVYVAGADGHGGQRVSAHGGSDPRWRADGKELYFIDATGMLTAVDVGSAPLRPVPLFPSRTMPPASPFLSQYVPSRDGRRFLVKVPLERLDSRPISVIMNWRLLLAAGG
jgi:Tol biopolymer transport system component